MRLTSHLVLLAALAGASALDTTQHANTTVKDAAKAPVKATADPTKNTISRYSLDSVQQGHANTIAYTALNYGSSYASHHACVTALTAAIGASSLYVYANARVPLSFIYSYDGVVVTDIDAVGLYLQQVSIYPNVGADMNPTVSTRQFLDKMVSIKGWQNMDPATLAQKVQKSASSARYAGHVGQAHSLCDRGRGGGGGGGGYYGGGGGEGDGDGDGGYHGGGGGGGGWGWGGGGDGGCSSYCKISRHAQHTFGLIEG
ncbi:hypothetical protein CF336_g1349 [Tilletia laevis]|uniref:Uncharacterized protein n=1 Tax=Tilletia caries TaxID=13290 RepID=A0A177VD19_9BASI|nr:hypothetical protein CF336_g1349 [Tilletia laevis]KAE8207768.1 hypothetical protein CF335_g902 [Tilletia laevis]KAE8264276.1 hypothetical protein A4X03_0g1068 [Tilletia caries]